MRRAMILIVAVSLLSGPALVSAEAPAARPAATMAGAVLIPDTYGGFIGLAAGADLPQNLATLRAFTSAPEDPSEVIQEIIDAIFTPGAVSYASDIAPWLGADIAIGANSEDDFVTLVATANTALSDAFVQKLIVYLSGQGIQLTPAIHEGVIIYEGQTVSVATAPNYLIYGSPAGVRAVIDVSAGKAKPLSETMGFKQAASGLSTSALATAYLSGEALKAFFADLGVDVSPLLSDVSVEGMGMSLAMEASSIRLDLALGWSRQVDGPVLSTTTAGSAAAQALPQDALGFFTSYDVRWPVRLGLALLAAQTYFQAVSDAILNNQPVPELPSVAVLQTQTNGFLALANLTLSQQLGATINIEEDVLKWMSGEYAVGFLRNPSGLYGDPRIPFDIAALVQVIDRNATLNTVEILSRFLASQLQLTPVLVNIGGYDLRAVADPATGGNLLVFGVVGDFLVMATGNGIEQLVNAASGATPALASNATWQARAATVDAATEGLFYFAVADFVDYARASLTGDLLAEFEAFNAPGLEPYQYVLAAADMRDGGLWTLSVLIEKK